MHFGISCRVCPFHLSRKALFSVWNAYSDSVTLFFLGGGIYLGKDEVHVHVGKDEVHVHVYTPIF